jgi:hypothetical protein
LRDLFRQQGDRILERDQLPAVGKPDRFIAASRPGHEVGLLSVVRMYLDDIRPRLDLSSPGGSRV